MFRCERCKEAQPQRSKPNVVVVEWYTDPTGHQPKQIKREEKICDRCAGKPVIERPVEKSAESAVENKADVAA